MFRLMFNPVVPERVNSLTKPTKILMRENSMQQVLFHFSRSTAVLRIFFSMKNLGQYKKIPWEICEEKRTFCKTFHSTRSFSWFFRIINVNQYFLAWNILCNEVNTARGHRKKHCLRYHLNSYGWLKLLTCSYTCR